MWSILDILCDPVMSGEVGCWCALFGTLVGVSVLSVMWLELESVSEISSPRWCMSATV